MRSNLPVTQTEYFFPESETLLSTTDETSHITYANAAFVRTSGFPTEELRGQAHNLVRHPDMPQAAFADMWRSLKAGQSWRALVKNRRKNGDHYWVQANVAPMRRKGRVVGYLSVRTRPAAPDVQACENLYRRFREGRAAGWAFHQGLVVRTGLLRCLSLSQTLPTAWRVRLPLALAGLCIISGLWLSGLAGHALWPLSALVLACLLPAGYCVEAQVCSPLRHIVKNAQLVASGEVGDGLAMNRCDDIGMLCRAITQAGLNLQSLVADVHEQVAGVHQASQEIATANHDLANRTEKAATNLQHTAAAMERQTAAVRQNSEAAQQVSTLAAAATQAAQQGGEAVADVVATMSLISDSGRRIADIISVIEGIAFQTNILALNAAVEAARAGDEGRGFAVVAGEVRSLAGRSSTAAREIKSLIEHSVANVDTGLQLVSQAGRTMGDLVTQVQRVSDLIAGISTASNAQTTGIAEVAHAIAQLDQMTQQNAAMVEQSNAAASNLSAQAKRLMEAVDVFSN